MANPSVNSGGSAYPSKISIDISPEHYLRLLWHRKWLVLAVFAVVTAATVLVTYRMPDLYTSETVILVDPQKVPDNYVKSTVTGDVRNRLGTLSQQILSASRLQKIIDTFGLYPAERKTLAREDLIMRMRSDISVSVVSDFGRAQDLQAFRITYRGRDPRVVAQVATELATMFIDENLKARELQASGTTEFLESQLRDVRKDLEAQEEKLRDFRMKHIGEMPEQQTATLQILGQLQSQLQLEGEALARAEQQRSVIQAMMSQSSSPVVDLDSETPRMPGENPASTASKAGRLETLKNDYQALLARGLTEAHPSVRAVKAKIADAEKSEPKVVASAPMPAEQAPAPRPIRGIPSNSPNPILQSQIKAVEEEIVKHRQEQARLSKAVEGYTTKLEAIPVREQEIADLVRDYEVSKAHYSQLLNSQLTAVTATQLEIRQKGEKFSVLDPAQPAQRPSAPNRPLINAAGAIAGLVLGLVLALLTEFLGMSITAPEQITEATGLPVLEVVPLIKTYSDVRIQRKRLIWATVSGLVVTVAASGAFLFYRYTS